MSKEDLLHERNVLLQRLELFNVKSPGRSRIEARLEEIENLLKQK